MKKFFTFVSMALVAMSMNAQNDWVADVDYVAAPEGQMAAEFTGATASGTNLIATIEKTPISLQYVSGKGVKELTSAQGGAVGLTPETWPEEGWDAASFKLGGDNKESQSTLLDGFYSVIGTGIPYVTFVSKQFWNEDNGFDERYYPGFNGGEGTDGWTYYTPDGAAGLPTSGAYIEAKTTTAGVMKVGCFVQAGDTRLLYIARKSNAKALAWTDDNNTTEYKVEGYSQSVKNSDNSWQFISSMPVGDYIIGNTTSYEWTDPTTNEPKSGNLLNSRKFIWFVFDADPSETYYIFGNNWQIGFQGVKFYAGKSIKDYETGGADGISEIATAASDNVPVYNLAGQRVSNDAKGLLIKNGKKFINK
ncbi:MAG: hypothetical protein J1E57_08815 [Prevotella sp.]|nr:hypothetical protein [Prevotella sp.]